MIGITECGDASKNLEWYSWCKEGKPAILITKDCATLMPMIEDCMNVIVHCTITGLGGTVLEPFVHNYKYQLEYFKKLYDKLGWKKVVLRIDPIIPYGNYIENALNVYKDVQEIYNINRNELRVRISFLDNYYHIQKRFKDNGVTPLQYPNNDLHAPLEDRERIAKLFGNNVEICGEPGMKCTGCVSKLDIETLGIEDNTNKLKGQRGACQCLAIKKELLNHKHQCVHKCIYCYWK